MKHLTPNVKKPFKIVGLFIVALVATTLLSSCDPDDEDEFYYYDIVGRWQQVAPEYGPVYDFYSDGTGMCYDDYYGDSYFEWDANNYSITLYFTDGYYDSEEYYTYSFQGNSLYLYPYSDTSNPLVLQPY